MALRSRKTSDLRQKEIENGEKLVKCARQGDHEGAKYLLEAGISVNAEEYNRCLFYKSQNYMTPLQCASCNGHDKCVKILLEYEAELDAADRFDVTAAHMAAENGHVLCVRLLLNAGADCNVATKCSKHGSYTAVPHIGGTTPLHLATRNNHIGCIKELILNGADYNAVDQIGRTSLFIASELGYEEAVLTHLRNAIGRDILSLPVEDTGETPLHQCVRLGMQSCVEELLQHGSDVNHINNIGFSPLHLSVHNTDKFSFTLVKTLITQGHNSEINLSDSTGATPLQYLCFHDNSKQERRPPIAAFLIAYGADYLKIKNKHGCSLFQQELRNTSKDKTILQAIVKTMVKLPSLETLGVSLTHCHIQTNTVYAAKCEWYKSLACKPRSLQHNSRCTVRKALGIKRLKQIHTLQVPTALQDYLLLEYDEYR